MPVPGLDERFITGVDLSPYFVDKDTGAALAGGKVYFYSDTQRLNSKLVYTLEGNPGAYQYTELPNPVTLSAVGTIQSGGNDVPLYYFPYDANGNVELYYVVVTDAAGVVQYTRQAWPTLAGSEIPTNDSGSQTNQISNPQFVDFVNDGAPSLSISFTGAGVKTFKIGSGWAITCTHSTDGTLTVTRNAIAGLSNYPTNPPFTITVTPSGGVTGVFLNQVLTVTPALWASKYISAGLLLGGNSSAEVRFYAPNNTYTTVLNASNTAVNPAYYTNTAQIPASTVANTGLNGFTILSIVLPADSASTLSSVQVISSFAGESVPYIQESANRQITQTFYNYRDNLLNKPISSYLVGWDFPLNPAQFVGRTVGASGSASFYTWDQTILFQSVASAFAISESTIGSIKITNTSGAGAQCALIQYLDQKAARKILAGSDFLSVQICGATSATAGVQTTTTLLYTAAGSLPVLPTSVVSSLNSAGGIASKNGTWTEVPVDGDRTMTAFLNAGGNENLQTISLESWVSALAAADAPTATFFAIVVGTGTIPAGQSIEFKSISLVPGNVATPPAPQTYDDVLRECQYYYTKSYLPSNYAGNSTTAGSIVAQQGMFSTATNGVYYAGAFMVDFNSTLRTTPSLSIYSTAGTASSVTYYVYNALSNTVTPISFSISNWTASGLGYIAANRAVYAPVLPFGIAGDGTDRVVYTAITFHYTADARLGVV